MSEPFENTIAAIELIDDGGSLGNGRLNGIAVSPDESTIWITVTGHLPGERNRVGAVLELPAFGE